MDHVGELDNWDRGDIRRTLWKDAADVPQIGSLVQPAGQKRLWEVIDHGRSWTEGPHRLTKLYLYLVPTDLTPEKIERAEREQNRRKIAQAAAQLFDAAVTMYGAVREDFPKSGRVEGVVMNYEIPDGPRGAVLRMNDGRLVAVEFKDEE